MVFSNLSEVHISKKNIRKYICERKDKINDNALDSVNCLIEDKSVSKLVK